MLEAGIDMTMEDAMIKRTGKGWRHCAIGAALAGSALAAGAASAPAARELETREEVAGHAAGCVEVEVNGMRSPSYDCLTDKLKPAASAAGARPPRQPESEAIAQRPGNQLGVFNWSATSQRMGNTFGTSVTPQRPAASPPPSPLIRPGS
ncbi:MULTISPECIES: hypothetical protein [unclassified Cupriavidus]|uniref:hypothetical protein n=1 Tax=unclassified Cupriavidus TaxID=2640874 RepID=UPI000A95D85E|nr:MULTISPECIES: hypothetical protein [unclassified Cupriavidus]